MSWYSQLDSIVILDICTLGQKSNNKCMHKNNSMRAISMEIKTLQIILLITT